MPTAYKAIECGVNYTSNLHHRNVKKTAPVTHTIADAILFTMGISASLAPALKHNNK